MTDYQFDRRTLARRGFLERAASLVAVDHTWRRLLSLAAPAKVRRYVETDAPAIQELLEPRFMGEHPLLRERGRALHLPRPGSPSFHRTLVAEAEGKIVGVGSAMVLPWHSTYYLADVMVDPAVRRRQIGTALLEGIRDEVARADRRPLFGQIRPNAPGGKAFAMARGFKSVMRSRQWLIDPNAAAVREWCAASAALQTGYQIRGDVDGQDSRFFDAIRRLYRWMHDGWNPLGDVSTEQVKVGFGPIIVPGSARLAFRGTEVVGVGCLMRRPRVPVMRPMISMVGPTSSDLVNGRELTAQLVAAAIERAREVGDGLEAEADDAHRAMVAVLEDLPAKVVGELDQVRDE